ncbi:MAG: hypothetical protein U0840_14225 [Gemmataceae bacterium]|jgi:hypothetical protein
MAEMTIRLFPDPTTGKKNIIISLHSDDDALPIEHEQQHRALVEKLINGGLVKATEIGKISVEREEDEKEVSLSGQNEAQAGKQASKQGG